MTKHLSFLTVFAALSILGACQTPSEPAQSQDNSQSRSVTVMSFNVQNLFDNSDDPGKDDKAYLPLAAKQSDEHIAACAEIEVDSWRAECLQLDWSDAAVDKKLSVLAATIRQVNAGAGADIIAFQEVENAAILNRLRNEHLQDLDYQPAVLIEGNDARGIDVAMLSKFPLSEAPQLHTFSVPEFPERSGDTRGILQANFDVGADVPLTVFSVHFPAPYHPTGMRIAAYQHLNALLKRLPRDQAAIAAGDFNTTSIEDERERLLDKFARPHWVVAHDIGCGACKGSYYYGRDANWSFLDMILFSAGRGEKATAQIRGESVAIANQFAAQNTPDGTPQRHVSETGLGVSDHWPLIATIVVTEKQ